MNVTLSVIIPVYNLEKYIEKCVRSILCQTYAEFEILLIDDGSTDRSREIIEKMCEMDKRIHVFCGEHKGVSWARNKGIEHAVGDYLLFMDGDDYIADDYVQTLFKLFAIDPSVDMVITDYYRDFEGEIKTLSECSNAVHIADKTFFLPALIKNNAFAGFIWNKCFKSEVINKNKIRFHEEIEVLEDMLFCMEYLNCANQVAYLEKPFYYYYQRKDSTLRNVKGCNYYNVTQLIAYEKMLEIANRYGKDFSQIIRDRYANLYVALYYTGDLEEEKYDVKEIRRLSSKIRDLHGQLGFRHYMMLWMMDHLPPVAHCIARKRKEKMKKMRGI